MCMSLCATGDMTRRVSAPFKGRTLGQQDTSRYDGPVLLTMTHEFLSRVWKRIRTV